MLQDRTDAAMDHQSVTAAIKHRRRSFSHHLTIAPVVR
jgi:hypothetical protein